MMLPCPTLWTFCHAPPPLYLSLSLSLHRLINYNSRQKNIEKYFITVKVIPENKKKSYYFCIIIIIVWEDSSSSSCSFFNIPARKKYSKFLRIPQFHGHQQLPLNRAPRRKMYSQYTNFFSRPRIASSVLIRESTTSIDLDHAIVEQSTKETEQNHRADHRNLAHKWNWIHAMLWSFFFFFLN